MMKDQISEDLLMNFGEPMKKMISDLIQQLKSELGEEELANIQNETNVQTDNFKDIKRDIAQIDELLKNPNLSEEDINILLDERASLQQNNNPEINN